MEISNRQPHQPPKLVQAIIWDRKTVTKIFTVFCITVSSSAWEAFITPPPGSECWATGSRLLSGSVSDVATRLWCDLRGFWLWVTGLGPPPLPLQVPLLRGRPTCLSPTFYTWNNSQFHTHSSLLLILINSFLPRVLLFDNNFTVRFLRHCISVKYHNVSTS